MTKIFVIGDIVSFALQAGGGGIQSAGLLGLYEIGDKIIVVGLFVQIVFFGSFMIISLVCHRRLASSNLCRSGYHTVEAPPLRPLYHKHHHSYPKRLSRH